MRRPSASGHARAATAVDASGMNSAAPYMGGTRAAAMEAASASKSAAATTTRECIIWN
jgi:hypothetical protein